jgi:bacterial/archaeal transporter family protein
MWVYLGILSAVFIGLYEVTKKHALIENAVLPVLFFVTVFCAILMTPATILSLYIPEAMIQYHLYVAPPSIVAHLHIFLKAVIVTASWILTYFALKHLPISIATPIRASEPIWILLAALLIFKEQPTFLQWAGLIAIVISYYIFSLLTIREGISFHRNKWIFFIVLATLISTCSLLYDKFLIQRLNYPPLMVQAWFSFYLVVVLGVIVTVFWYPFRKHHTPFTWKWSILLIACLLIIGDFAYFQAVSCNGSLIMLISVLRRTSVVVSFFVGAALFHDVNISGKTLVFAGILLGVLLIVLSK